MRETTGPKKHLILSLLTLACILIDAGFFWAAGAGLKWLAEATSPLVPAALAAIAILAVRIFWSIKSLRWVRPSSNYGAVTSS